MIRTFSRFRLVAVLVLAPLASSSAAQGETGFLRGEGNTDIVLTYGVDTYDSFWVGSNKVKDSGVGTVNRRSTNIYIAHGLTEDTDLVVNLSHVSSNSDGTGGAPDESAWQDIIVSLKYRVVNERLGDGTFAWLLEPGVKTPLSNYEDNAITAIGDGQTDYRARTIVQWHADNGFFAAAETGYDIRTGRPHNEVPLNITLGYTVWQALTLMPFWSLNDQFGGYNLSDVPAKGGFPGVEEDTERYGISAFWRITDDLGLTGTMRRTIDGKNTGDTDTYAVGVVVRF